MKIEMVNKGPIGQFSIQAENEQDIVSLNLMFAWANANKMPIGILSADTTDGGQISGFDFGFFVQQQPETQNTSNSEAAGLDLVHPNKVVDELPDHLGNQSVSQPEST